MKFERRNVRMLFLLVFVCNSLLVSPIGVDGASRHQAFNTPMRSATTTPPSTKLTRDFAAASSATLTSPLAVQALNISTRLRVEIGDHAMIGGFIITGSEAKTVAIRGIGPSLTGSGLTDVLADPTLELHGSDGTLLEQNDNWQDNAKQAAQLIALGLALADPAESGIVAILQPGAYTAVLAGKNQTSGIGLIEIYDGASAATSKLSNLSTRGFVQTGNDVLIGGFILGQGSAPGYANIVVRGIGPSLSQSGISDALVDPTLELRDSNGALLVENDNWGDDTFSSAQLMAHGLAPQDAVESGIFASLPPGAFTTILAGKNNTIGTGLVELYVLPQPTTLFVTSTEDSGTGSLRQLLMTANDGDTIHFAEALNGSTITLTNGQLTIDRNITISGPGSASLTIARSSDKSTPLFRIFEISGNGKAVTRVTISGLTMANGHPDDFGDGGGIRINAATLTVNDCKFTLNSAGGGAGIFNDASGQASAVTANHCVFDGNSGGAIVNSAMDVDGSLTVNNCVFSNNLTSGEGGSLFNSASGVATANLTVNNCIFSDNSASSGGAISNFAPFSGNAIVTVTDSTITDNTATVRSGGGVSNYTTVGGSATVTLLNCTISNNSAYFYGGGVGNGAGTVQITNCTLNNNSAGGGGGVYNEYDGAVVHVANCTFSSNAANSGGAIYSRIKNEAATVTLSNTIFFIGSGFGGTLRGAITSLGYNLSSENDGTLLNGPGDQININPLLGPLQDNGGPTLTYALQPGSPAINAGDPNFTPPPFYDQRGAGFDRVSSGRIDIGSFEVQGTASRNLHGQNEK